MLCSDQTRYIFIPGKNWKLSLAELVAFLKGRDVGFMVAELSKSFFIITTQSSLDRGTIDSLGGTIKIGETLSQIPTEMVEDAFLKRRERDLRDIRNWLLSDCVFDKLFERPLPKHVFGVSLYFENPRFLQLSKKIQRFVGSRFKEALVARGTKARFMGFPEKRRLPQLTHVEVLKKELVENGVEILFCIGRQHVFISKTMGVHNPFEFQKRDIGRPIQRRIYSIPPRLAKIMVNLAKCLPGATLLDPFCGVGTILQEALLTGACVIGMDIDPWCVKASCVNLDWLRNQYNLKEAKYEVLRGDSRSLVAKIEKEIVDCIVTEPDLGPPLRHYPTQTYAKRIIDKLRPLYFDFLEGSYKTLKSEGRLVFITPRIRTRSRGFITLDLEEKAEAIGFRIVHPFEGEAFNGNSLNEELTTMSSSVDEEERHRIGREINVLQK